MDSSLKGVAPTSLHSIFILDICDNVCLSLIRLCSLRHLEMPPFFRLDNGMLQSGEAGVPTARMMETYQEAVCQKFGLTLERNHVISTGLYR